MFIYVVMFFGLLEEITRTYYCINLRVNEVYDNGEGVLLSLLAGGTNIKPATHLAILYADRGDRRKSSGVSGAAIAIFADRRDRRIKSPLSGMSDIGD